MRKMLFLTLMSLMTINCLAQFQSQGLVKNEGGYTNVRSGCGTNYRIVDKYMDGTCINYTDLGNGWVAVYDGSTDGYASKIGYMARNKVVDYPRDDVEPFFVVDEGGYTNVRKAPGGAISSKVKDGSIVLGNVNDMDKKWIRVYTQGGKLLGYMSASKLEFWGRP